MSQHPGHVGRASSSDDWTSVRRDWWPLLRLILLLAATGAALYATAGPPRLPAELPDGHVWWATLRGTSIPLAALGYLLAMLAWVIWAWLSASLVLRLLVALADLATHGAVWARSLRRVSDRFTLPLVRRAVDGALAVAVVVNVVARGAPAHAAELVEPPAIVRMVDMVDMVDAERAVTQQRGVRLATYSVRRSDTLWSIAERFYGTGHEYPRLVEANVGRAMPDGLVFDETGVIQPGWTLRIPLPSARLEEQDGEVFYTVERGDTLWGISARFLGDPLRWPEIYEHNRASAALPDGRTLHDPNLIWPELRLRMPLAIDTETPPEVARAPLPVETPVVAVTDTVGEVEAASGLATNDTSAVFNGGAAGGVVLAGVAIGALLVRRRGRRGLDEPPIGDEPESDFIVRGGFADLSDLGRTRAEPSHVAALEALRFFDERGLEGSLGLVTTRHGRSGTTLALVSQRLADRPRIVEAAAGLSARLGVAVTAHLSRDHDILLRLGRLHHARFTSAAGTASAPCRVLPLGVLPDRRVLGVNWPALGHVLVAGRGRGAVSTVLTSLVANLAAQARPEDVELLTIARDQVLSSTLQRLPHQVGSPIDPADHLATTAVLHDVRAELLRRMERVERGDLVETLPELVVVIPELDVLLEHLSTLEMLGAYGPAHRVRLLAATTHSRALPDRLVAHFTTRAVLRVQDEADSTRLLGSSAAVELLGGGQLLVRLDEREPVEVYSFRVAEAQLDQLVRGLRGEPLQATPMPPRAGWSVAGEVEVDDDRDADEVVAPQIVAHDLLSLGARPGGPTVEVRCLGGFDVLGGQHDLTAAASPAEAAEKASAWELLAYLASQPEGVVAREDVLLALWPALEARQAGRVFHGTLERLNLLLQPALSQLEARPAVWLDDRDGTCRLDLTRVESDVHRFVRLCRAAPLMPADQAVDVWARARALYRGDLFDGPGGRAYAWAVRPTGDGELSLRDALREQSYRATLRQARLLVRAGEPSQAVPLFRALLDVEPLLEDVVRDLYRCYGALGDLDSLRAEDQRLRQALLRACGPEDDPDPEPATAALFARVREDLELKATVPA
jgi:two-component SAPR family response regulator/LysM repeat protein